jgi:hypothetical protein
VKITMTSESIEDMKSDLRTTMSAAGSCHRAEALARGLGWGTYAAMRSAVSGGPAECDVYPGAFAAYLSAHGIEATEGHLVQSALRTQIRAVMAAEGQLTHFGFGVYNGGRLPVAEWRIKFAENRASMLSDKGVAEFLRACEYLARLDTIKTVNRKHSSYGLKHAAERHHRRNAYADRRTDAYVSNGMLLAAAYHLGMRVARASWDSPNAYLNVSSRSFRELDGNRKSLPQPEPGQHFRVLGYDHGRYFYLPAGASRHVALRAVDHIPSKLVRLAPLEHWTSLFPPKDRQAPFDTARAVDTLFIQARAAGIFGAEQ